MIVELNKTFTFEAAHHLPSLPDGHKCRQLHGHSFAVELTVRGEVDSDTGLLMDYAKILAAAEPVKRQLDHTCLNEVEGLKNPTSENLSIWIWQRLKPNLPELTAVTIRENCSSACTFRGES